MSQQEVKTKIFTLKFLKRDGAEVYRLESADWVNVIPITSDKQVVLVKQFRHGIDKETLESPGGFWDAKDKDACEAAKRELMEETGYSGGEWKSLGWAHTNPAILNNRLHFFFATNVKKTGNPSPDPHEKTEAVLKPLSEIPKLIANQTITHSLIINAFAFLSMQHPDLLSWKK